MAVESGAGRIETLPIQARDDHGCAVLQKPMSGRQAYPPRTTSYQEDVPGDLHLCCLLLLSHPR
jgi:hypothetical protein